MKELVFDLDDLLREENAIPYQPRPEKPNYRIVIQSREGLPANTRLSFDLYESAVGDVQAISVTPAIRSLVSGSRVEIGEGATAAKPGGIAIGRDAKTY